MVNHKLVKIIAIAAVIFLSILLLQPSSTSPETTILEMTMVPVEGTDGEYILEYSNGNRELLKKDGSRVPLNKVSIGAK